MKRNAVDGKWYLYVGNCSRCDKRRKLYQHRSNRTGWVEAYCCECITVDEEEKELTHSEWCKKHNIPHKHEDAEP